MSSTYNLSIKTISLLLAAVTLAPPAMAASTPGGQALPPRSVDLHISARSRVIVISPHPDDAVLGAGGLMQRAVDRHASVEVVEMTSGDGFPKGVVALRRARQLSADAYRWYGTLREHEALAAMHQLGVARSRVRLLGFPDEGLCALADTRSPEAVFSSPYTHRDGPATAEQLLPGAKYRGEDLRSELENLLLAFRPSVIVLPDSHDEHPDHCATHLLVHEAAEFAVRRGLHPPTFVHYLIHYRNWPIDSTAVPLEAGGMALRLTAAERAAKTRALDVYRSQLIIMPTFMRGFARSEERFVIGDESSRPACWCGGENIAAGGPAR